MSKVPELGELSKSRKDIQFSIELVAMIYRYRKNQKLTKPEAELISKIFEVYGGINNDKTS